MFAVTVEINFPSVLPWLTECPTQNSHHLLLLTHKQFTLHVHVASLAGTGTLFVQYIDSQRSQH